MLPPSSRPKNKPTGFLLGLIFDPEDGGDMFFRNVVDFQWIKQRLHTGRWKSSIADLPLKDKFIRGIN
jgi:hypothetical protein